MTPDQFKQARARLGLTQSELSKALKVDIRQVQRWESGETAIKMPIEMAIKYIASKPHVYGTERVGVYKVNIETGEQDDQGHKRND